ncbi:MAG: sensor histidine kinase, partial [Dokdonella sp.]
WWATLASIVVFLPLYFTAYRSTGTPVILCMLGIAALGYALLPINPFSNTYIVYAAGFAAYNGRSLLQRFTWMFAILGSFIVEIITIGYPLFIGAITSIIVVAVFFGNHYFNETTRKRAELRLSHEEVRRLAALAERERIGRDLHDLLGHTLSLVALKSELAGKLIDRDVHAARREIDEVTRVSRDALAQVRRAVTGIRAAGLGAELASAKLMLESDGVMFRYALGDASLPPHVETVLALTVRESITNILRHARAARAEVSLETRADEVRLVITDDGRGSDVVPGNGLTGMRERVEALGGTLRIDSIAGRGTRLEVRVPAQAEEGLVGSSSPTPRWAMR